MNYVKVVSAMINAKDTIQLKPFLKNLSGEFNPIEYAIVKNEITNELIKNNLNDYIKYMI